MEDSLKKEVKRLKEELARKKEEARSIADLVKEEIDLRFVHDPRELSERELEGFIEENLLPLKENIDVNPDPMVLTSHRKVLGRPILSLKRTFMKMIRFYTQLITPKQTRFNEHSAALLEALIARSRRNREELRAIAERIGRLEENIVLLRAALKDLKAGLETRKDRAAGAGPSEKE